VPNTNPGLIENLFLLSCPGKPGLLEALLSLLQLPR
jgi:hypothetical protein